MNDSPDRKLIANEHDQKFNEKSPYRDWPWAVLFAIQFIGMIAMGAYYANRESVDFDGVTFADHLFGMMGVLLGGGAIVTMVYLAIIRSCARVMIWFTLMLSVIGFALGAIAFFAAGEALLGGIMALFCALNLLYIYLIRKRIAFAVAMLEICSACIQNYPSTIFVSVFGLLLQVVWIVIWSIGAGYSLQDIQSNPDNSDGTANFVYFFLVLSMYWTAQVIQNVVHVTVAGLVATWYFFSPEAMPQNPTAKALKRSCTTSLGSICLGSLIVAVIQTLRTIVEQARGQNNDNWFIQCCLECILRCVERLIQYFNLYAFTQVAIYGKSYCEAAKAMWQLIQSRGFEMIINDDLIGGVLAFGATFGGLVNLGISLLATNYLYDDVSTDDKAIWAVVGFVIGYVMVVCAMVVIQSSVATVFVCFAEDPMALASTKRDLYDKLGFAWNERRENKQDWPEYPGAGRP